MGVTSGSQDLEHAVIDREQRHIESSTTEIVDDDLRLAALLVETVGNRSGGRLVDDTEHLEAGDRTRVLGRLTLGIVKVGGDGDDRVRDGAAKVSLGSLLHLAENHGRDLLGGLEKSISR